IERRQYITRESVDTLIGQLKELAARHQKADTYTEEQMSPPAGDDRAQRPTTGAVDAGVKRGTPEKRDEKQTGEYEEQLVAMGARIKELENKNFTLEIDKSAREQVVNLMREQMAHQTKEFSAQIAQQSRRVGQLETEMRLLTAPDRDRRPTRRNDTSID